jgi:hypothetical protein
MHTAFRSILTNLSRGGDDKPEYARMTAGLHVGKTERRDAMSTPFVIAATIREMRP